jgi:rhamnogalacturonyl hydrolase YesR
MCQLCFSRRDLIKMAAAGTALPLIETTVGASESYPPPSGDYLTAAKDAAVWIRSSSKKTDQGLFWLPEPDHPEKTSTITPAATIYSGNAGTALFFVELANATGDHSYLDDATQGADYVLSTWKDVTSFPLIKLKNAHLDFNHGLSGTAYSLAQIGRATGQQKYRDAAVEITNRIVAAATPAGKGIEWTGAQSAGLGDGSIALYLLWAATELENPSYAKIAAQAGTRFLEVAEQQPDGGLRWVGFPFEKLGLKPGTYMPSFESGTAGVAFVLARLYQETKDPRFLDAAQRGAQHIQRISTIKGDSALLFYREPDEKSLFYLGYCSGPVGYSRVFYTLSQITGDKSYLEWVERYARGISESGAPAHQTPGLWNVVCQCCGTAGITDLFTSLFVVTSKPEYLAFAKQVADYTISRGANLDGRGLRWYQAWTRVKPTEVTAETGFMIGASGVGASLLRLHRAEQNDYRAFLFPDNPFPTRRNA